MEPGDYPYITGHGDKELGNKKPRVPKDSTVIYAYAGSYLKPIMVLVKLPCCQRVNREAPKGNTTQTGGAGGLEANATA